MKKSIQAVAYVALTVFAGAAGCGDDDGGGAGSSSGVSGSKKLADASDADAKKICKWVGSRLSKAEPTDKQYCTVEGLYETDNSSDCKDYVDECLDALADYEDDNSSDDCSDASGADIPAGCTATVAEFEACINAQLSTYQKLYGEASCSDTDSLDGLDDNPSECVKLENKCPGIFDDGDAITEGDDFADDSDI